MLMLGRLREPGFTSRGRSISGAKEELDCLSLQRKNELLAILEDIRSIGNEGTHTGHVEEFTDEELSKVINVYDNYNRISNKHFSNDYIDVMRLARKALPNLKHHRLKDVKHHFGFNDHQEHRAASDVLDTKRIFDAIQREISLSQDIELFKKIFLKQSLSAKDILNKETDCDQSNPFYESYVCFTGKMDSIVRREAMQLICDLGGFPQDRITMQTNYLVLGDTSYSVNVKDGVTGKMKKAQQLIGKGQELEILSESC